jgi:hypothetical protein
MNTELLKIALERWAVAALIGIILIAFRKDKNIVIADIERMLIRNPIFSIISIVFLFVVAPFTIPFSLHNIFKRNDNTPNNRKPDE